MTVFTFMLDLQKFTRELEEEKQKEMINKVIGCISEFKEVFRLMQEMKKRFPIRFNIEKDMGIAKLRIEVFWIATGEMIAIFEYHIVESERIKSDMEDLEKKLIEDDRVTKAKEIVKSLDNYAQIRGWNCYFSDLEACKSTAILKAVLLSRKEKYPRFVSFWLDDSIDEIEEQIKRIKLSY